MLPDSIRLAFNVAQALRHPPLALRRSLLGEPASWSRQTCPPTELQLGEPANWLKAAQTLAYIGIPAVPRRLPRWVRLRPALKPAVRLFLRPSRVYRYRDAACRPDPTPEQAWFFINGICTDRQVLMLNAAYLSKLFHRPLTLLHNSTCSLLPDLAECAIGKAWDGVTESVRSAFAPLYAALKSPAKQRVILIAHSQGTIIASVLLWMLRSLYPPTAAAVLEGPIRCPEQRVARKLAALWHFDEAQAGARKSGAAGAVSPMLSAQELAKLEIYAIANCASRMEPIIDHPLGHALTYLESHGNQHDVVARLGVLAPSGGLGGAVIGGERFARHGAWGHLLNAHYLYPMEREWRAARRSDGVKSGMEPLPGNHQLLPRLFEYFAGASPAAAPGACGNQPSVGRLPEQAADGFEE